MNMHHGYQIVEPASLATLLGNQSQATLAVAMIEWAIHRLKTESPELFEEVTIDVLAVSYQGVYPAIGLRYRHDTTPDLGSRISEMIDAMIERLSVGDFISFVAASNLSWWEFWQELKEKG